MTNDVKIRPADYSDIASLYPELVSVPYSLRAWAVELNGETVALAGFILQPINPIVFSMVKSGLDVPKRLFMRTALEMLEILRDTGLPLSAIRDTTFSNSDKFLRFLGFRLEARQNGEEVYKWRQFH